MASTNPKSLTTHGNGEPSYSRCPASKKRADKSTKNRIPQPLDAVQSGHPDRRFLALLLLFRCQTFPSPTEPVGRRDALVVSHDAASYKSRRAAEASEPSSPSQRHTLSSSSPPLLPPFQHHDAGPTAVIQIPQDAPPKASNPRRPIQQHIAFVPSCAATPALNLPVEITPSPVQSSASAEGTMSNFQVFSGASAAAPATARKSSGSGTGSRAEGNRSSRRARLQNAHASSMP